MQGSLLGSQLFLLYINNLHRSVKHSKTYPLTDDTNIMQSNKSLDILSKNLNMKSSCKTNKLNLKAKQKSSTWKAWQVCTNISIKSATKNSNSLVRSDMKTLWSWIAGLLFSPLWWGITFLSLYDLQGWLTSDHKEEVVYLTALSLVILRPNCQV